MHSDILTIVQVLGQTAYEEFSAGTFTSSASLAMAPSNMSNKHKFRDLTRGLLSDTTVQFTADSHHAFDNLDPEKYCPPDLSKNTPDMADA